MVSGTATSSNNLVHIHNEKELIYNVPICYEPGIDKAPVVLTIRTNSFAKEERQRLAALNVPVIENKPLARALYKTMKIGEAHIPKEFYRDVAVIISTLRKHKKRGK